MILRSVVPGPLKQRLRPLYSRIRKNRLFRRLATLNYSCGRIAFGERNTYLATPARWITVDIGDADYNIDLTRHERLPFADNTQALIYSAHMIEHIDQETLVHLLKEAHRILKPGGAIRLEAPDLEVIVAEYKKASSKILEYFMRDLEENIVKKFGYPAEYCDRHIALISFISCYVEDNHHVPVYATKAEVDAKLESLSLEDFGHWCVSLQTKEQQLTHGHVNPLYYDKLHAHLSACGFRDIRRMRNGETQILNLRLAGIERELRAPFSFYVDARK